MANKPDYYEVLGLSKDASPEDVTRAYRRLAMQYHPDRNPGNKDEAEARFREVTEAHEVLRDPEKRRRYDRYGHAGLQTGDIPDFASGGVFSSIFDIFNSVFGGEGAGGPQQGRDLQVVVELELQEAALGTTRTVPVRGAEKCGRCKGSGAAEGGQRETCSVCKGRRVVLRRQGFFSVQTDCPNCQARGFVISKPCPECRGLGRVIGERKVEIPLPPGVEHGRNYCMEGEGEAGEDGAGRGDLYVGVRIKPHPLFERHGDDLVCQAIITFPQAALGTDIEIPTIDGRRLKQSVPRGIQSGEIVTVPGEGMTNLRGRRKGNLLVQVIVETPKKPTKRQEELLRELAAIEDTEVTPQRKNWLERIKQFFTKPSK